jgi:hypothetical protein
MRKKIFASGIFLLGCGEISTSFANHIITNAHWDRSTLEANIRLQDESEFNQWLEANDLEDEYADFVQYLSEKNVSDVVLPWQLLRQGTDWEEEGHPPFAMAPRDKWHEILPTLELIRDDIIPEIGAVEVVSGYRTREYNSVAGGSRNSQHLYFSAVDLIPEKRISRDTLVSSLRGIYVESGDHHHMGLGIYSNVRFHVDTHRKRTW